jgi:hypothetical protein
VGDCSRTSTEHTFNGSASASLRVNFAISRAVCRSEYLSEGSHLTQLTASPHSSEKYLGSYAGSFSGESEVTCYDGVS